MGILIFIRSIRYRYTNTLLIIPYIVRYTEFFRITLTGQQTNKVAPHLERPTAKDAAPELGAKTGSKFSRWPLRTVGCIVGLSKKIGKTMAKLVETLEIFGMPWNKINIFWLVITFVVKVAFFSYPRFPDRPNCTIRNCTMCHSAATRTSLVLKDCFTTLQWKSTYECKFS